MAASDAATGLEASFPAQPPQVAEIRRSVSAFARRAGAETDTLIRVELAVSEAATNVVLHAYRSAAPGRIHVLADIRRSVLDVRIRDHGCGMAPHPGSPGMGLGLSLMATESDRFEIRSAEGGGTEVSLRFRLPGRAHGSVGRAAVGQPASA